MKTRIALSTIVLMVLTIFLATSAMAQVTASGVVGLKAQLSHGYIEADKPQEIYGSIDMRAQELRTERRVPMNLSVVLDRSGSMSGERWVQARRATRDLINMLSEQDRLSLVTYGSDVTLEFASMYATPRNKRKMLSAVDALQISGMTNLSGGLEMGIGQTQAHAKDDTINRVIMMSDGNANVGITSVEGLGALARAGLEVGVSTSTLGFGLDYNSTLMTKMAVEGAGNYYFIEREDALAGIFAQEISGISNTVARNSRVVIDLADGVELLELHGFTHRQQGNRVTIPLTEFYARQSKDIFVKLHTSAKETGKQPIMNVRLIYFDVAADREVTLRVNLEAVSTRDSALVEEHINGAVLARGQHIDIANSMKRAMTRYEEGKPQEAAKILEEQRTRTGAARVQYDFADGESFERVEKEMAKMEDDIKANPSPRSAPAQRMRKQSSKRSHDMVQSIEAF
ncbi:MAG: VWA domain-containing protein [Bradymonadaceae bacterium]